MAKNKSRKQKKEGITDAKEFGSCDLQGQKAEQFKAEAVSRLVNEWGFPKQRAEECADSFIAAVNRTNKEFKEVALKNP